MSAAAREAALLSEGTTTKQREDRLPQAGSVVWPQFCTSPPHPHVPAFGLPEESLHATSGILVTLEEFLPLVSFPIQVSHQV